MRTGILILLAYVGGLCQVEISALDIQKWRPNTYHRYWAPENGIPLSSVACVGGGTWDFSMYNSGDTLSKTHFITRILLDAGRDNGFVLKPGWKLPVTSSSFPWELRRGTIEAACHGRAILPHGFACDVLAIRTMQVYFAPVAQSTLVWYSFDLVSREHGVVAHVGTLVESDTTLFLPGLEYAKSRVFTSVGTDWQEFETVRHFAATGCAAPNTVGLAYARVSERPIAPVCVGHRPRPVGEFAGDVVGLIESSVSLLRTGQSW